MNNNNLEYALVLTLNGNYILKPLAKAEACYDDIEMEFYGSMESIKAQKKAHLAEMKADGLLIDYNNMEEWKWLLKLESKMSLELTEYTQPVKMLLRLHSLQKLRL